jgi:hypothetical protein
LLLLLLLLLISLDVHDVLVAIDLLAAAASQIVILFTDVCVVLADVERINYSRKFLLVHPKIMSKYCSTITRMLAYSN